MGDEIIFDQTVEVLEIVPESNGAQNSINGAITEGQPIHTQINRGIPGALDIRVGDNIQIRVVRPQIIESE